MKQSQDAAFFRLDWLWAAGGTLIATAVTEFFVGAEFRLFIRANGVQLSTSIAEIGAGLFGFVVAGISVALALVQDPRLAVFRKSRHYFTLWKLFRASAWTLGLLAVMGIVGAFLTDVLPEFFFAILFMLIFAGLRLGHVVATVFKLTNAVAVIDEAIDQERQRFERDVDAMLDSEDA